MSNVSESSSPAKDPDRQAIRTARHKKKPLDPFINKLLNIQIPSRILRNETNKIVIS
jgi:hypothetical protein